MTDNATPPEPDELDLATYDLDDDGEISIAHEGGVKGSLAGALHKLVDKLDNDG
jgi:hypothetical protein